MAVSSSKHSFHFSLSEFLLAIFVLFSGIMLAFSSGGFVISFEKVGFSMLSTMQKGVTAVTSEVTNFVYSVQELSRLRQENKELSDRLKNYEFLQRNNAEIKKENERLKEQLGFSTRIQEKNFPAQIIGRNPDSLYSSFTINRGSKNGIKKNMPVLAIQNGVVGLVGKIVTVSSGTSLVMPVYDASCSISARIQNTRDVGILSGQGSHETPLSLRYIKKRVLGEIHVGDVIVTSGETGNYIRDIPIGTIIQAAEVPYDSSLVIEVMPLIDFSRLESVIVTDIREVNASALSRE